MDFCLLLKIWVKTLVKNLSGKYSAGTLAMCPEERQETIDELRLK